MDGAQGETWGYETAALPGGRKFPGGNMSLSRWQSIGVVRANGKPFPRPSDSAELKVPDGREGPVFLVTKNFQVIKRYNNSDKYALAVGLLADQIAGYGGLVRDWNRPFERLSYTETEELQNVSARLAIMTVRSMARSVQARVPPSAPSRHAAACSRTAIPARKSCAACAETEPGARNAGHEGQTDQKI